MILKVVHYKVKNDELDVVQDAVREFIKAIGEHEPSTYYEAFQSHEDEHRFFHIMKFLNHAAEENHKSAPYTKKFVDILYPRCSEQPVFTDISSVSST